MVWDDHTYCVRCDKHSAECWCGDEWPEGQQCDLSDKAFTVHLIYALNDPRAVCNDQIYIPPPTDYCGLLRLCNECYLRTLREEPT